MFNYLGFNSEYRHLHAYTALTNKHTDTNTNTCYEKKKGKKTKERKKVEEYEKLDVTVVSLVNIV